MVENDRSKQQQSGDTSQQTQTGNQSSQTQNTSGQGGQDQNPQGGGHWNNYRTRELSDEGTGEGKASTPNRE